jgi:hypothetical protein
MQFISTSTWLLCDLFWSTNVLCTGENSMFFSKRLKPGYFFSEPDGFIETHLPCDPVFQFDHYPIMMGSFINFSDDTVPARLPYIDFLDSINTFIKLSTRDPSLRIAGNAYRYNSSNPNLLIVEYYNYGVFLLNNKASDRTDLIRAGKYFAAALSLIAESRQKDIVALKSSCLKGIQMADKRLKAR